MTTALRSPTGTRLHIVIYAPNSTVTFDNFRTSGGAVAAKRVVVQNNFEIRWDPRVANLLLGDVPLPTYTREVLGRMRAGVRPAPRTPAAEASSQDAFLTPVLFFRLCPGKTAQRP